MHIEKNVCDSLIGLLLNIPGKTKDGINVRRDMQDMKIRQELHPKENAGKRTYLPAACYTLSRAEKVSFCQSLSRVKVPSGYSANVRRLVSMKDLKLLGMKSHDCHVLMTQMIPVAIRGILPDRIRHTITKLCLFFSMIHSKVIDPEGLDALQGELILTLCQLEMYFPPSFFDVMVHLVSHIVGEIKACGPVFLRYMYPFERYMGILKGYVRNRNRPEGSIIEGYCCEEVIDFCTDYLAGVQHVGIPRSRHEGRLGGKGTTGLNMCVPDDRSDLQNAHFFVLQHMISIDRYVNEHKEMLRLKKKQGNITKTNWLASEHKKQFASWLRAKALREQLDDEVQQLGMGPRCVVAKYQAYDINGYTFYTNKQDRKTTLQNSGVTLVAATTDDSAENGHQRRETIAKESFYGVIQEIWELEYGVLTIPLFRCKWVDNGKGVKVNKDGFTLVNLSTNGYKDEPFILANQANQVFFVEDPEDSNWHIVMHGKRRILGVDNVVDEEEYNQFDELPPFSIGIKPLNVANDDTTYIRTDHEEVQYMD